ncbi:MAG: hypothetical protein BMS9Abin31_0926 [Gammaproteobacteria bacterium]|nr:MAG: hypothetical protein BMS9Abin31_0926 [Gammaproteobacteria bacterium]
MRKDGSGKRQKSGSKEINRRDAENAKENQITIFKFL